MNTPQNTRNTAQQRKQADIATTADKMVRLKILEGAAGVRPGTWTRGMLDMAEAAGAFPELHRMWTTNRETGIYSLIMTALLKMGIRSEQAEELRQDIIMGTTVPGTPGGALAYIGKRLAPKLMTNSKDAFEKAKADLWKHSQQKGRDLRRLKEERTQHVTISPVEKDDSVVEVQIPTFGDLDPQTQADALMLALRGPAKRHVWAFLRKVWKTLGRPSDVAIMDAWLQDPGKSDTALGEELGVSSSMVGQAKKRLIGIARKAIPRSPHIMKMIDMEMEKAQLGFGGGSRGFRVAHLSQRFLYEKLASLVLDKIEGTIGS